MAMLLRRAGLLGSVRPAGWRSPAAPRRLASSQQRRTARAEKKLAKARTYLAEQGYAPETVEGILRTLEKTPGVSASVSMLRSMGEIGLRSLVESVDAEAEALAAKRAGKARVHIRVAVPHEGLGGDLALRFDAFEGDNLMDIAAADPLLRGYIECACDGLMACSTCHVIVRPPPSPLPTCHCFLQRRRLPPQVSPEHWESVGPAKPQEHDMLDLAYGLTDTSRLGCQITLTAEMDGLLVTVPDGVNNMW